jgi:hypothetical protein
MLEELINEMNQYKKRFIDAIHRRDNFQIKEYLDHYCNSAFRTSLFYSNLILNTEESLKIMNALKLQTPEIRSRIEILKRDEVFLRRDYSKINENLRTLIEFRDKYLSKEEKN